MKKKIDTTLHYIQYILARIFLVGLIGFLIYSIVTKKVDAIIFCCLFLIFTLVLLKKVFDKPIEILFDKEFIYLEKGTEPIALKNIISVRGNRILYNSGGMELKIKLPNFHFMDKNWKELNKLIKRKKH